MAHSKTNIDFYYWLTNMQHPKIIVHLKTFLSPSFLPDTAIPV